MHPICAALRGGVPTGRGPGTARVMPTGGKAILLVKNFEKVCVRGGGVGGIPQHIFLELSSLREENLD